jgi:hypothetical protein
MSSTDATAFPLPFTVRLRPPSVGLVRFDAEDSSVDEVSDLLPASIGAICLLSPTHIDTGPAASVAGLSPVEAFTRLLPHALEFNPSDRARRKRLLEAYLDLAAIVPVFQIRFRPGPDSFSAVLDAIAAALDLGEAKPPRSEAVR